MPSSPKHTMPQEDVVNQERTKTRRFAPEPIEQSSWNNRQSGPQSSPKCDVTKPRRFVPQVLEQDSKSNRSGSGADEQMSKPKARRFAPQPVETSYTSSKGKGAKTRFLPEPIESSSRSNRPTSGRESNRKFAPVLIDTAKRSRRAGGDQQPSPQEYRTEYGHNIHANEHRQHVTRNKALADEHSHSSRHHIVGHAVDFADLPRRPPSPLDGSAPSRSSCLAPARHHSFRCPDLDTIESSESERGSAPSSLSSSPGQGSPLTASDTSFTDFYKHATRIRESVDENFSHYLLQLEAKKAQERMREQALAAFPNSDFHEPVQHYVDDGQESDEFEYEDRVVTWDGFDEDGLLTLTKRRDSTKISWEQMEMQRHAERLEQDRKVNGITNMRESSRSPWWNPILAGTLHDSDVQMRSMRDRARPPMLGNDLVFPRCPSPEPARFDVTQGSSVLRQQVSSRVGSNEVKSSVPSLWAAAAAAKKSSGDKRVGLWGGFCAASDEDKANGGLAPPVGPTGLMTPRDEPANPFEKSFALNRTLGGLNSGDASHGMIATPPTPPAEVRSAPDIPGIDAVLVNDYEAERDIIASYPDTFITQVFNYLSLGYPALARPFDEELAKISRISIADLRQDDVKARQSPRGYIRLDQGFEGGGGEQVVSQTECVRWRALKLYIHEWARQEKNMVASPIDSAAGGASQVGAVIERRGSWGI